LVPAESKADGAGFERGRKARSAERRSREREARTRRRRRPTYGRGSIAQGSIEGALHNKRVHVRYRIGTLIRLIGLVRH
jgi:hypothetical protein